MKKSLLAIIFFCIAFDSTSQIAEYYNNNIITNTGGGNIYTSPSSFHNSNLGTFTCTGTLTLNGAQTDTKKGGTCDITGSKLAYRIYKQGSSAPSFTEIILPFSADFGSCFGGSAFCQRWEKNNAGINLLSGLANGNYYLEVYFVGSSQFCSITNFYDSNSSANYRASFTVNSPLSIATQTASSPTTVCIGSTANLTTTASGADFYQWQELISGTWTNVSGATANNTNNATYTTPTLTSAKTYRCRFTNCGGLNEVFSNQITITPTQPIITLQPNSQTDCDGNTVDFILNSATGTNFQWQRKKPADASFSNVTITTNTVVTNGTGTTTLKINNIGNTENPHLTIYRCIVTDANTCTNTSSEATLSVNSLNNISDVSICQNGAATFTAGIVGTLTNIKWQKGTIETTAGSYSDLTDNANINGSATNTLTLSNVPFTDNNTFYRIRTTFTTITNAGAGTCNRTMSATATATGKLTVNAAPTAPTVTDAARCGEGSVTLNASGAGTNEDYRWYVDNTTATPFQSSGDSYTTPSLSATKSYYVSKTKSYTSPSMTCESATRTQVTATVNPIPSITLGTIPSACANATTFSLPYIATTGSPDRYSITVGSPVLSGFVTITDANLITSPLNIAKPTTTTPETVQFNIKVKNTTLTPNCESPTQTFNLTLTQPTSISTQPTNKIVCEDGSTSFTVAAIGTGTINYQWKKGTDNIGTNSATLNLMNVPLTDNGASITCEVSSDCGMVISEAKTLTVNPKTKITVQPSALSACEGTDAIFMITATGTGDLHYQWKKNGNNVGTDDDVLTLTNVVLSDNNAVITCVVTSDCGSATSDDAILTVNPTPTSPSVTSPVNYCQNATASPLSATATGTNTLLWWGTNSIGGVSSASVSPLTNATGTFTYYVSQKTSFGCEGPRAAISVVISPAVSVTIAGLDNICTTGLLNRTTTLTATPSGGNGTYTYQWKNTSGNIASETNISYTANTPSTYSVEVTSGVCTAVSNNIIVNGLLGIATPTSITGTLSVCGSGQTTSLTANPTSVLGTYHWYSSASTTSSLATGNPYSATTGTYYVGRRFTQSSIECESERISTTVNDGTPTAPATFTGITTICSGTNTNLSTTDCGTGTAKWYDAATAGNLLITNNSYTTLNLSSNTTYYVSCNSTNNCESSRTAVTVYVTTRPNPPSTFTGITTICSNTATSLSAVCGNGNQAKWYDAATNGTLLSTGNDYTTATLTADKTYYVSCIQTSDLFCESSGRTSIAVTILSIPNQPTITNSAGKTTFCNTESSFTLSSSVCSAGIAQYRLNESTWTDGSSISINPANYSSNTTLNYEFRCTVSNNGTSCSSSNASTSITINAAPVITTQPSNHTQCKGGSAVSFSVLPNIFSSYQWQRKLPSGSFVDVNTSTGLSISGNILTASSIGTTNEHLTEFRVIISQNGCTTTSNSAILNVNSISGTMINRINICDGASTTFDLTGLTVTGNLTGYQWRSSTSASSGFGNITEVSPYNGVTSNTLTINPVSSSINNRYYKIRGTFTNTLSGSCGVDSDDAGQLTVSSPSTPSITVTNSSICNGESTTLTATNCNGTVVWSNAASGTSITVNPSVDTDYTAKCSLNGCESVNSNIQTITVKSRPAVPTNSTTTPVCEGTTLTFSAIGSNLLWYNSATGGTGSTTAPSYITPNTYNHWVSQTVNGCEGTRLQITGIINAKPASPTNTTTSSVCEGTILTFSATGSNLLWYNAATGGEGLLAAPSYTAIGNYSHWVSQTINNCESDRLKIDASIIAKPTAPVAVGNAICNGTSTTLTISNTCSGTLTWFTASNNSTVSMPVSPVTNTDYYAKCTVGSCTSDASNTVSVVVNSIPALPTNTTTNVCFGNTLTFSATGSNLLWYTSATGGIGSTTAPTETAGGTFTHYVSQTLNSCESARLPITASIKKITINTQPSNQSNCDGNSVTFSLSATYNLTGTLNYQWQRKKPTDAGFTNITSATNASFSIADAGVGEDVNGTQYQCMISIDGCSVTSNAATLTVNKLTGTLSSQTVCSGSNVTFNLNSFTITGNIISYQWQKRVGTAGSFVDISGETNSFLTINNVSSIDNNTYYQCKVIFSNCSRTTDDARLTVNTLNLTTNPTNVSCNGGSNGQFIASVSGGSTPYSYSKDGANFQSSGTFSNLNAGTYTITAKDNINCVTTTTVTIIQPTAISVSTSKTDVSCSGDATGQITVTASGGTGTLTYSNGGAFQSSNVFNSLSAGNYTITVKDANNCTATSTVNIGAGQVTALPTNTTTNVCFGNTLTFSATGSNLLWYTSATGGTGNATAPSETAGGTYTYYVTQNVNSCESARLPITASIKKITINTQPTNQSNCDGNSVTFSLSATYNLTGTLNYQWQRKKPTDAGFTNITSATNASFSIADAGVGEDVNGTQYQCVISIDGCSVTSNAATLTVNKLTGTLSSQTVCSGSNVTFNLNSFTITGNIISYQWQKRVGSSGSFVDISGETNSFLTINNVSSIDNNTYYQCKVIFSNCSRTTDDARLTVNTLNLTTNPTNVSCNSETNGQIVASVTGGSTPYSYSRNGTDFQSSGTFNSLSAGTYTITAKDNINCVTTTTVTITQPTAISISTNKTDVNCSGDATGQITVTASGGTGTLTYSNGGAFQASNVFSSLTAGNYTITVKDANSCTATSTVNIGAGQVTALPTNTTNNVCFGNTLTFSATGSNLLWYTSATGGTSSTTAPTETAGGTYTYYVTQNVNSCESARLPITASVKKITINTQPSNQSNCDGNSVTFSLSAVYNLSSTLNYQWQRKKPTDAGFTNITSATNASFSIADAGVGEDVNGTQYQCVISIDGCSITSSAATLTVNKLTGTLSSQTVCAGSNGTFNLNSFTITGNIISYQWQKRVGSSGSFVDMVGEINSSLTISNVSATDDNTYYKCRVIFSNCNRLTDDARLTVTSPTTPILSGTTTICQGENATLTASACTGGTVIWTNGNSSTSITVNPSIITDYTAICKISTCESPVSNIVTVSVRAGIATPTNTTPASINAPNILTFSATPTISGATLYWYGSATGGTGSTVAPQFATPNTYTQYVSQKDPISGCESPRLAITATIVNVFRITQQPINQGECKGNTAFMSVRVAGSTTTTYRWQRKKPTEATFTDIGQVDPDLRISNAGGADHPHLSEYRCIVSNGSTTFTTNTAILKVNSIQGNIPNVGACIGKKAELNLAFWTSITGEIAGYQWQTRPGTSGVWTNMTDGDGIVGSKTSKLEFSNPTFANTAYYRCEIKFTTEGNACSEFTDSGRMLVSSYPPPPSTTQYFEYCQFTRATRLSTFDQNPDLDVLWYTSPTGGVGTSVAPTPSTAVAGELKYYATQITNEGCESETRKEVIVKVKAQPALPIDKTPDSVEEGSPFTFQAEGQNLRWYGNQTTTIGSNQAPTFTNVGNYTFYVTQTIDGCESNRLQIRASITSILKFTKQPISQTDCEANSVTYSLTATGRSSVQYQWQRKLPNSTQFVNIVGETANSLKISNIGNNENPDGTQYRCEIKDNAESKISEIVNLNVNSVKGTFDTINLCEGSKATINLDGLKINGNVVSYQWQKRINGNYSDIQNEIKSTLNTSESGIYRAKLVFAIDSKNTCSENTNTATVEVKPLPEAPKVVDLKICQNDKKTLTASATTGNTLLWYNAATGGIASTVTPILNTNQVGKNSYFVAQQDKFACESKRAELVVTVNPTPASPTVTPEINYCKNAPSETLKASSDAKNTILWYNSATGGTASTTAPKPTTDTENQTIYYTSALNSNACESPRIAIKVNVTPCIASLTEACLQVSADNVQGNRWFDIFDVNGNLYASVNPNGLNLGKVSVSIKKYPNTPVSSNGTRILQRFADFQSSVLNQFDKPVSIRIYHTNQEFEAYKTASNQPNLTINDFNIIHYDGVREDCDWLNNDNFKDGESVLIYKDVKGLQIAPTFFALQFDVNSFSELAATGNDMAETQFDAIKVNNKQVQLDWKTLLEVRAEKFIIQRSKDGKKWANLLEKKAIGLAGTYQDFDNLPLSGKSFYRLIYIDKDGVKKIFDAREINIEAGEPICKVVPNPVSVNEDIKLYVSNIQPKTVNLYSSSGQNIAFKSKIDDNELLNIKPNTVLQAGVYFVKISDGEKVCVGKVVRN